MNPLPRPCLVDTNVPIVANGHSPQADDDLVEKCIDALLTITNDGGLVIDSDGRIFEEYRQKLSMSGQPGTGDQFMKWVHDHQWITSLCERRDIRCLDESAQEFAEFPASDALKDFDRSDRKFVAVANAREPKRPILEAVDFKWCGWRDALAAEGIEVVFIDEEAVKRGYARHEGNG
jgi:hypothetical protein